MRQSLKSVTKVERQDNDTVGVSLGSQFSGPTAPLVLTSSCYCAGKPQFANSIGLRLKIGHGRQRVFIESWAGAPAICVAVTIYSNFRILKQEEINSWHDFAFNVRDWQGLDDNSIFWFPGLQCWL